jgi:cysteine-rich repeat protein
MGAAKWAVGSAVSIATIGACTIYGDDLLEPTGSGGGGGQGPATTSSTGGAGTCQSPADCQGEDTTCAVRTCILGECGVDPAAAGTPCTRMGGQYCDAEGSCVECVFESHCAANETCSDNACVVEQSLPNGASCSTPDACMSRMCVDDVCCADACTGTCEACDVQGRLGDCVLVPDGTDPDGECPGECVAGACAPVCGDMTEQPGEECDDGNTEPFDGCSPGCLDEAPHLVITEVKNTPTAAEFVEIHNPTSAAIDLTNYYLADYNGYHLITSGMGNPASSDFRVRFPAATQIAAHAFVVVSLDTATGFFTAVGAYPDFDFAAADANAPDMLGSFGGTSGLTDASEMVVLFHWDGAASTVDDVDYMAWGNDTTVRVDKTGVAGYAPDTAVAAQVAAGGTSYSQHRCDTAETSETKSGGNGITGHDETSESGSAAFQATNMAAPPSPGAPPPMGFCP